MEGELLIVEKVLVGMSVREFGSASSLQPNLDDLQTVNLESIVSGWTHWEVPQEFSNALDSLDNSPGILYGSPEKSNFLKART